MTDNQREELRNLLLLNASAIENNEGGLSIKTILEIMPEIEEILNPKESVKSGFSQHPIEEDDECVIGKGVNE